MVRTLPLTWIRPYLDAGPVRSVQRGVGQQLSTAQAEQVADRDVQALLGQYGVHAGLQRAAPGDQLGPVTYQLPQFAHLGWGDVGLGQAAHPEQIGQIGGVADVVLHPAIGETLDAQRMRQMHLRPAVA